MGDTVTLSAESRGISRITIARPERKNAFDASLIAELTAAVQRVDGSAIAAQRAHEIGLVERLVEPSDLDAAVGRVLDAIVSGGPKAVNAAKRLVREVEGKRVDEIADLTVKRIAEIRVSHEGQEGQRASLERR